MPDTSPSQSLSVGACDGYRENADDCAGLEHGRVSGYEVEYRPTQRHVHVDGAHREYADGHVFADRVGVRENGSL